MTDRQIKLYSNEKIFEEYACRNIGEDRFHFVEDIVPSILEYVEEITFQVISPRHEGPGDWLTRESIRDKFFIFRLFIF